MQILENFVGGIRFTYLHCLSEEMAVGCLNKEFFTEQKDFGYPCRQCSGTVPIWRKSLAQPEKLQCKADSPSLAC